MTKVIKIKTELWQRGRPCDDVEGAGGVSGL